MTVALALAVSYSMALCDWPGWCHPGHSKRYGPERLIWREQVELAVVIGTDSHGRLCKDVSPQTALDFVHGYTVANDIGAR